MFFSKQKDLVCGMKISKDTEYKSTYKNKEYYFCSLNCEKEFDKKTGKYAK